MQNFSKHAFAFALGICMVAASIFIIWQTHSNKVKEAHASATDNVSGFAWSENIGWISFNDTDSGAGGGQSYGVNYTVATEQLTGYAWSENIGWIKFDPVGPYPGAPNNSAKLNLSSEETSGWARACAGSPNGDCTGGVGPNANSGGWDGWIKLAKDSSDGGASYGVIFTKVTKEFSGWAWGGDVVGWISFNSQTDGSGVQYAVKGSFNTPPTVSDLSTNTVSVCASPTYQQFSWNFSDAEDGSTQTSYQLQVATDSDFSTLIIDTGVVTTPSTSRSIMVSLPPTSNLQFNTSYFWRVQAFDSLAASSGWANGPNFTTPQNPLPSVNFTWQPSIANISENEYVFFTDATNFYSSTQGWLWVITNATYQNGTNNTSQNPVVTFNTIGDQTATLTATNNVGSCSVEKSLGTIKTPLPQFKEVKPQ
ncbi:MAG: hypothetical protein HYV65_02945 [Candidatus Spechtbacteria bacterium]|nr:hypothetical protein [Candidatus Spechtbacteria bacterium]